MDVTRRPKIEGIKITIAINKNKTCINKLGTICLSNSGSTTLYKAQNEKAAKIKYIRKTISLLRVNWKNFGSFISLIYGLPFLNNLLLFWLYSHFITKAVLISFDKIRSELAN